MIITDRNVNKNEMISAGVKIFMMLKSCSLMLIKCGRKLFLNMKNMTVNKII